MGLKQMWRATPAGVRTLALALFTIQAAFVVAHLIAHDAAAGALDPNADRQRWDFNQEGSIQTWWSGLVMGATGAVVIAVALRAKLSRRRLVPWLLMGLGFLWIGAEEALLQLHEESQMASGVDWPILYAPAVATAIWVINSVRRDLDQPFGGLLLVALVVLCAAVGTELLSSPQIAIDFELRNLVEENLELAGSTLLLIAVLAGAPRRSSRQSPLIVS